MKIYLISQDENNDYNTYDSAVVYAKDEEEAKTINPSGKWEKKNAIRDWCYSPKQVEVEYIGEAPLQKEKGIILSSYNAG